MRDRRWHMRTAIPAHPFGIVHIDIHVEALQTGLTRLIISCNDRSIKIDDLARASIPASPCK